MKSTSLVNESLSPLFPVKQCSRRLFDGFSFFIGIDRYILYIYIYIYMLYLYVYSVIANSPSVIRGNTIGKKRYISIYIPKISNYTPPHISIPIQK